MGHYYYPTRRLTATAVGLNAALVGTGLNVLRFNAATIVGINVAGNGLAISDAAATGTEITVTKRGLYACHLIVAGQADGDFAAGISLAAPATALQAADNPLPATAAFAGTLLAGGFITSDAGVAAPLSLSAVAVIAQDDITAGNNVIRFHANDNGGMAVADADITQTQCMYRVEYIGNLKGS